MIPGDHPTQTTGATIRATTTGTRGLTALAASLLLALPTPLAQDAGGRTDRDEILELRKEIATKKARLDSLESASLRGEIGARKARIDSLDRESAVSIGTLSWMGMAGGVMSVSGLFGRIFFEDEVNSALGRKISICALAAGVALLALFALVRHTTHDQAFETRDELSDLRDKLSEIEED